MDSGGAKLNAPYNVFISGKYAFLASYNSNALKTVNIGEPVPSPFITKIAPVSGQQGGTYTITITGTNFEPNKSTVSISETGVSVKSYKTRTASKIIGIIVISPKAAKGKRTITVKNPTLGKTAPGTFTVAGGPTITKISPVYGQKGGIYTVTITGAKFEVKKSIVSISGTGVSVKSYPTRTASRIVCKIAISVKATTGKRTITVKNPTGGGTATGVFSIRSKSGIETQTNPTTGGVLRSPVSARPFGTDLPGITGTSGALVSGHVPI